METMGTDGQRILTPEEREASQPMQTIKPRWLNNVLVMTCTAMTTVLMIVIPVLLAKHFEMKALVSMLAITSLPSLIEAENFTAAAIASALVAPNPVIGTKVVCTYPVAVIWQNKLKAEIGDKGVSQSPKREKSQKKKKVQVEHG